MIKTTTNPVCVMNEIAKCAKSAFAFETFSTCMGCETEPVTDMKTGDVTLKLYSGDVDEEKYDLCETIIVRYSALQDQYCVKLILSGQGCAGTEAASPQEYNFDLITIKFCQKCGNSTLLARVYPFRPSWGVSRDLHGAAEHIIYMLANKYGMAYQWLDT